MKHHFLYPATQALIRFGCKLFFYKLYHQQLNRVPLEGPVMLVANHPNAFLDPLIIAAFLKRPTHFLARGDVFNIKGLSSLISTFHVLPVYRISEGKENISKNFETFDVCFEVFKKEGMVLLFGDGLCENNWRLRPMKKGPARLAKMAWLSDTPARNLKVVPVGLTYEHFSGGGKSAVVAFGNPFDMKVIGVNPESPQFTQLFNEYLSNQLSQLAFTNETMTPNNIEHHQLMSQWITLEKSDNFNLSDLHQFASMVPSTKRKRFVTLIHKGIIGLPHYWFMQFISLITAGKTVFYDSVLFILTLALFPLYWITLLLILLLNL
ncbi:MAG: 1-acyl-sn-glycerol-3-phosphate acyltransferase [Bacteroidia bacterium]|nr:1-acyl-sn-glycerol-3-phosphate acyltransferase [Bacteroidia bacterium]